MSWELSRRRFVRSVNSKFIYGRIVCVSSLSISFFPASLLPDSCGWFALCRHQSALHNLAIRRHLAPLLALFLDPSQFVFQHPRLIGELSIGC